MGAEQSGGHSRDPGKTKEGRASLNLSGSHCLDQMWGALNRDENGWRQIYFEGRSGRIGW